MTEKEKVMAPAATENEAFERLSRVCRVLRAPDGCPWDRVQTHETLIRPMIEEAYEAVSAIENQDKENLREELGDVALQVVMHAQIAEDEGDFSLKDVLNEEAEKMIRRHPHVFGENLNKSPFTGANAVDNVLKLWENVKQCEKSETTQTEAMEKIPAQLPALLRAEKIQAKAAKVGFDWDSVSGAFDKVAEETDELKEAAASGDQVHMQEELGDLLFAVVNVSRFLKVDPEEALRQAAAKFQRRFAYVEKTAKDSGRSLVDMTLAQMDVLWNEAKLIEGNR